MSQPLPRAGWLRSDSIGHERPALRRKPVQQRLCEGMHDVPVAADVYDSDGAHRRRAVRVPAGLRARGGRGRRVHRVRAR